LTKPVSQVARAIEDRDTAFLSQLTGIGKRTAEKIVATLNGKVLAFAASQSPETDIASTEPQDAVPEEKQIMVRQVTEVLTEQLGHSASSARRMIQQALEKNPGISSPEDLFDEIYQETK
jgi:Holliday junction DNA helicase RuvA